MRVISGRAKGRKLKKVPGDTTRPIMDRVKESLFNILAGTGYITDTRWLDLFAGTGQVGIEALSRGAREAIFLDTARAAVRTIQDNLRHTGLQREAQVLQADAFAYLRQYVGEPFDVIYVAPPQYKGLWAEVMTLLDERPFHYLSPHGIVVVQIDPKEFQELPLRQFHLYDKRRYGNTLLCFYEPVLPDK
ncbi:MAG: 16S rRNA (guanine(966)-N(2))-methyltransferase RsmD [Chloroflexi bacterium]|nr:MAG: 16S rRNA (guanine(966)-N(2))-methyltransferase RsmD [Chloroflexota bacterium]